VSSVAHIVIVDDTPANLQLLDHVLALHGYHVRAFPRGDLALRAIEQDPPDLILLDINMPGLTGYDVCRQLKSLPQTRDIPVLFVSALTEPFDKVKAFAVGGVDYLTKPLQVEEVYARVATHLHLRHTQRELEQRNRQVEDSYRQLRELEGLRDQLTHMLVHDMRNPLMVIRGYLQMIEMMRGRPQTDERIGRYLRDGLAAVDTLVEMVSATLDVSRMESHQLELAIAEHDLAALARQTAEQQRPLLEQKHLTIVTPQETTPVWCDDGLIGRVFANLLGNAIKFTPEGGTITIGTAADETLASGWVSDNGPGIPPEHHQRIFEKFGQVHDRQQGVKYSTGLGLSFCRMAVEAHGGTITVASELGVGTTFRFALPRRPPTAPETAAQL
jgi:signal transduction histidine kinase